MKAFWVYISTDEELTSQDQIKEICKEIQSQVAHVVEAIPSSPTQEN